MKTKPFSVVYKSPFGPLRVSGTGARISGIQLGAAGKGVGSMPARVRGALDGYFQGRPKKALFSFQGTPFQKKVWKQLATIPWGGSISYAELARRVKRPKAVRAVAGACAANPIAIAIPCHRVLRTDGSLSGYRWGVERKRALLEREAAVVDPLV